MEERGGAYRTGDITFMLTFPLPFLLQVGVKGEEGGIFLEYSRASHPFFFNLLSTATGLGAFCVPYFE